jgi:hypothetical protein
MNTSKWNSKISWSWHLDSSYVCVLLSPWFGIDFILVCSIICKETSTRVSNVAGNHNLWISFYGLEMTTKVCTWVWLFWGHRILKWLSSAVFLEISKLKHVSFLREGNIWVTVSVSGFAVSWGVIFHMEARASFCGICSSWCSSACMWPSHLLIQHLNKTSSSK